MILRKPGSRLNLADRICGVGYMPANAGKPDRYVVSLLDSSKGYQYQIIIGVMELSKLCADLLKLKLDSEV